MTKKQPYQAPITGTNTGVNTPKGNGGFMTGIILGSLIGAAAALLSSPKSGREVRTLLDERTAPTRQRLTEQTQVVREKAEPLVGEWIQIAKDKAAPMIEKAKKNPSVQEAAKYAGYEKDQASIDAALADAEKLVQEIEKEIGDDVNGSSVAARVDSETVAELSDLNTCLEKNRAEETAKPKGTEADLSKSVDEKQGEQKPKK